VACLDVVDRDGCSADQAGSARCGARREWRAPQAGRLTDVTEAAVGLLVAVDVVEVGVLLGAKVVAQLQRKRNERLERVSVRRSGGAGGGGIPRAHLERAESQVSVQAARQRMHWSSACLPSREVLVLAFSSAVRFSPSAAPRPISQISPPPAAHRIKLYSPTGKARK
jgi:hypothetical protein